MTYPSLNEHLYLPPSAPRHTLTIQVTPEFFQKLKSSAANYEPPVKMSSLARYYIALGMKHDSERHKEPSLTAAE